MWTIQKITDLRMLWKAGRPTNLIARDLGPGFTKNMVIGKARRLKLRKRSKSKAMRTWWAEHQAAKIADRSTGAIA